MYDLAYATFDDETTDEWLVDDHGRCVCWFLLEGRSCSRGRMSVAPLWDVFSIVSSVRAIQMLAAFAFHFCFQFLLAAFCAVMLMGSFCLLRTGFESACLQAPFVSGSWFLRTCCTCLER